jgi:hypothetical protein
MGLVVSSRTVIKRNATGGGVLVGQQFITAPVIENVYTVDEVTADQTAVPAVGSGFGIVEGTIELRQDDGALVVTQTANSWTNYAIEFDVTQGGLRYGELTVFRVTIA